MMNNEFQNIEKLNAESWLSLSILSDILINLSLKQLVVSLNSDQLSF